MAPFSSNFSTILECPFADAHMRAVMPSCMRRRKKEQQMYTTATSYIIDNELWNAGGAYTRDATSSLTITPSLLVKHDLIVGGGGGRV